MSGKWQKIVAEYLEAFAVAFILAFLIRAFVIQAFKIPSGSMLDTLQIGDHLLVNKFIYGLRIPFTDKFIVKFSDPKFQDIIVFEYPLDPSKDFIKRVIGLPGDKIQVINKIVYRNGKKLIEPYVKHTDPNIIPTRDNFGPITVPEGKYFVMGDNRDESYDSRFWGFVDRNKILGKAFIIYWSWQGFSNIRWNRIGKIIH
ncbi:signal peptidase I . Serine peptidase. MEROPS family S26A [Desulfonauticus submarinus]|uniref:Signal peptidase I n=1 Tax=Desulfonauticus submarinus TaxID=206665 RepID=A0A1H0DBK0_9BACT|nr:signal peptidase I [Desulfonauticus submarinus]SDN67550.1 signal peptidase I . Serine peptidase. MEROPS family S26A [Desulfonauticus submarinus]